jgi:polysaccharide biosynthesis protein PslH
MKILFLSSWYPYPPINGAKLRILNLIKQLSLSHQIHLVSFANTIPVSDARAHIPDMLKYCKTVEVFQKKSFNRKTASSFLSFFSRLPRYLAETYSPEFDNCVKKAIQTEEFDVVIASEVTAITWTSIIATQQSRIPVILDSIEIGQRRDAYHRQNRIVKRVRYGMMLLKDQWLTRSVLRNANVCIVPSEIEKGYIRELAPGGLQIEVVPHCLEIKDYWLENRSIDPASLVFVGSFSHHPNKDGLIFFLKEILPEIKREVPDVVVKIAGSLNGCTPEELTTDPSVQFLGLIPNVKDLVGNSYASIVPIRIGAGTRVKIIESMALGTPVISTSKGAEGLKVKSGKNILIADNPLEFAKQTVQLLHNRNLRDQISVGGLQLVSVEYSTRILKERYESILDGLKR